MRTSSYQTANQNHNNNFNSTPETEPEWFHVGVNHFQEMERSSKFISVQSVGDYMYGLSVESVVEAMQSSNTCVFVCPPEVSNVWVFLGQKRPHKPYCCIILYKTLFS